MAPQGTKPEVVTGNQADDTRPLIKETIRITLKANPELAKAREAERAGGIYCGYDTIVIDKP